jgi:hypothetical protein
MHNSVAKYIYIYIYIYSLIYRRALTLLRAWYWCQVGHNMKIVLYNFIPL